MKIHPHYKIHMNYKKIRIKEIPNFLATSNFLGLDAVPIMVLTPTTFLAICIKIGQLHQHQHVFKS